MTTQTTSLFVYGTLKRGHRLNSVLGGGSTLVYPAITLLNNYDLQGYADAFPIMTLTEEGEGYRILGELYSVMPSVMDRVNSIEGGAGYIPYIVDVRPMDSNEKRVEQAITFIYPNTDKYMTLSPINSTKMSDITGEVKVWA